MKTSTSLILAVLIIVTAGYFVTRDMSDTLDTNGRPVVKNPTMNFPARYKAPSNENTNTVSDGGNVIVKEGIQYITITVSGGYAPRVSSAKSGLPTKLIMKTNGTYDCSSSLVIRSLNYRKVLPATGETSIDAGTPQAESRIEGVCGMGMYSFKVEFK